MWRRFFIQTVAVFAGGSALLFLLLALADPWGTLPFRSPLPRIPADHSQRWAYPELARDKQFDAAVIGNSTTRLLDPADLDPAAAARFVNLSMVGSLAYEQLQLFDVFLRAHPSPRAVLFGIDRFWCKEGTDQPHFSYGPLPAWLYGGDWRDGLANLLNIHALETAWRSGSALLGWSPRDFSANGYQHVASDHRPYDPALARTLIGQNLAERWDPPADPDPAHWHYAALDWLEARLEHVPPTTRVMLVFVPRLHLYPAPGTPAAAMVAECKRRVVALAEARPNAAVYDTSMPSPMTLDESRWWDAIHMRSEPMAALSHDLAAAIAGTPGPNVAVLAETPGPRAALTSPTPRPRRID